MPKKSYLIVHDGTNVLVATGGKSGHKKKTREGYHLPGGSVDKKESSADTALREFEEETGFNPNLLEVVGIVASDNAPGAEFVVAMVKSVNDLVKNFKRPEVENEYDEPFEKLISLSVTDCWKDPGFAEKYYTDWFGFGLLAAHEKGLFK